MSPDKRTDRKTARHSALTAPAAVAALRAARAPVAPAAAEKESIVGGGPGFRGVASALYCRMNVEAPRVQFASRAEFAGCRL